MYHLFMLQDTKVTFWRVAIEGSKEAAEEYFSQYFKVEYIDEFPMLISSDIDEEQGVGSRKHKLPSGEFTVRTFKHIKTMMSQDRSYNWFSAIQKTHQKIKSSMEFQIKEQERKKKLKEEQKDRRRKKGMAIK